jgi:hypothetical protein
MLDLTGILFSSVIILIVVVRAVQMDRSEPWFQTTKRKQALVAKSKRAWQPFR